MAEVLQKVKAYSDEQRNGLVRTGLFAGAWLLALLLSLASESPNGNLDKYKHDDHHTYEKNLSSFAIIQACGLGLDLALHVLKKCRADKPGNLSKLNDMLRELAILATACTGLVAFTYGMVLQGAQHTFSNTSNESPVSLQRAVATYSYLATAVLGMARLRNIDLGELGEDGKRGPPRDQTFKTFGRDDIETSVGAKYNKVPTQPAAHNFY